MRVTASHAPPTLHDRPVQALYSARYATHGHPALARHVREQLAATGMACEENLERGLASGACGTGRGAGSSAPGERAPGGQR